MHGEDILPSLPPLLPSSRPPVFTPLTPPQILDEIVSTEKTYVRSLEMTLKFFLRPLLALARRAAEDQPDGAAAAAAGARSGSFTFSLRGRSQRQLFAATAPAAAGLGGPIVSPAAAAALGLGEDDVTGWPGRGLSDLGYFAGLQVTQNQVSTRMHAPAPARTRPHAHARTPRTHTHGQDTRPFPPGAGSWCGTAPAV